jgi:large subunit ribosomal protein L9
MKIINLEEDRIEKVSDGYARNYLLPKGLAILATPKAIAQMEKRAEANRKVREEKKQQAQELADKLSANDLVIAADAGEEGKLFGTVTNADVATAIKDALGIELDRRKINLNDHIKAVGTYTA